MRDTIKRCNILVLGVPKGKKRDLEGGRHFFSNMSKDMFLATAKKIMHWISQVDIRHQKADSERVGKFSITLPF